MNLLRAASRAPDDESNSDPAERNRADDIRRLLGILFLVFQGVLITYARIQPEPVVHLSPVGGHTSYRVFVTIDGRSLEPAQVSDRYRIPPRGRTTLTPDGLHELIREYESGCGRNDQARVRLHTRYNNDTEEIWLWPQM